MWLFINVPNSLSKPSNTPRNHQRNHSGGWYLQPRHTITKVLHTGADKALDPGSKLRVWYREFPNPVSVNMFMVSELYLTSIGMAFLPSCKAADVEQMGGRKTCGLRGVQHLCCTNRIKSFWHFKIPVLTASWCGNHIQQFVRGIRSPRLNLVPFHNIEIPYRLANQSIHSCCVTWQSPANVSRCWPGLSQSKCGMLKTRFTRVAKTLTGYKLSNFLFKDWTELATWQFSTLFGFKICRKKAFWGLMGAFFLHTLKAKQSGKSAISQKLPYTSWKSHWQHMHTYQWLFHTKQQLGLSSTAGQPSTTFAADLSWIEAGWCEGWAGTACA